MSSASIRVTNAQELQSAIASAVAGDTISLADGDYGGLYLFQKEFSKNITIKAENAYGAKFDAITLREADGFHFDGIEAGRFTANFGIDDMSLSNSRVYGSVFIRDAKNVVIDNNDIGGSADNVASAQGLNLVDTQGFAVTGNYVHHAGEDLLRITGNSNGGVVEGNFLYDVVAAAGIHADLFQMFGAHGKSPHDIIIRNNVAIDDIKTGVPGAQGFFFTDSQGVGYQNLLVENNIIMSGAPNSLTIRNATENVRFLDNTVISSETGAGGTIRLGGDNSGLTIDGNLHKSWYFENDTGATILDNHAYGKADLTDLLRGDDRLDWQSYLPAINSAAGFGSGYGAQELLKALLLESQKTAAAPVDRMIETGVAFSQTSAVSMRGLMDNRIQTIKHDADIALDQGTISFSFKAASTYWARTIFSKESSDTGDNIALVVRHDKLFLYVEDGKLDRMIELIGLKAGESHDFQLSFDGNHVRVFIDGIEEAAVQSDFTLAGNTNDLVIGARNSGSGDDAKLYQPWHGQISGFTIHDQALTAQELAQVKAGGSVSRPAPVQEEADEQSPLHWLLEQTKNSINLDDSALDKNGNIVDISIEARTVHAEAVFQHAADLKFNGKAGTQKVIAHDSAMELEEGTITVDFRTSITKYHRTILSKESKEMGHDIEVWVKNGKIYIEVQDGDSTKLISAAVRDATTYDLKIGFDGEKVVSWLNGKKIGEVNSDFNLAENTEALVLGAGNNGKSGHVSPTTNFHGDIYDVGFFSEKLLKDGTLPTRVIPIEDMNLADTPPQAAALPQFSKAMATPTAQPDIVTPEFAFADELVFNGTAGKQVVLEHSEDMEISAGVLAVNFRTSLTSHHRTILSKESKEMGNDIEIWIKNGQLHIEVEDGSSTKLISTKISASSNYDLKVGFDGEQVTAWLNDTKIGGVASGFDMSKNDEALIIGGGNGSLSGGVKAQTAFHGNIYSVELYDEDALRYLPQPTDDFLF